MKPVLRDILGAYALHPGVLHACDLPRIVSLLECLAHAVRHLVERDVALAKDWISLNAASREREGNNERPEWEVSAAHNVVAINGRAGARPTRGHQQLYRRHGPL